MMHKERKVGRQLPIGSALPTAYCLLPTFDSMQKKELRGIFISIGSLFLRNA